MPSKSLQRGNKVCIVTMASCSCREKNGIVIITVILDDKLMKESRSRKQNAMKLLLLKLNESAKINITMEHCPQTEL